MTAEEAIKGLKVLAKDFSGYKPNEEMFEMAIEALEKQIPKKIISKDDYADCPACGEIIRYQPEGYCKHCGRAIYWRTKDDE